MYKSGIKFSKFSKEPPYLCFPICCGHLVQISANLDKNWRCWYVWHRISQNVNFLLFVYKSEQFSLCIIWFPVKVMHGRPSYGSKYPFFIFVHESIDRLSHWLQQVQLHSSLIQDYVENIIVIRKIFFNSNQDQQNFFKCLKLVMLT